MGTPWGSQIRTIRWVRAAVRSWVRPHAPTPAVAPRRAAQAMPTCSTMATTLAGSLTNEDIRHAEELAGCPGEAEAMVKTVHKCR